jgi:hypothetical protein
VNGPTLKGIAGIMPDECFHKTVLNEFYRIAFRKKVYHSINELQADLDAWMCAYNTASQHPSFYVIEEKRFC